MKILLKKKQVNVIREYMNVASIEARKRVTNAIHGGFEDAVVHALIKEFNTLSEIVDKLDIYLED